MDAAEWWANLLQGSVGAVVGLMGVFGVFWLTRRHEVDRDKRVRDLDKARAAEERTLAGVASIMEASHATRTTGAVDETADRLARELVLFCVREIRDHPNAARWAKEQSSEVLQCAAPHLDFRALPWQAGMIATVLTDWVASGCPDSYPRPEAKPKEPSKPETTEPRPEKISRAEMSSPTPQTIAKLMRLEPKMTEVLLASHPELLKALKELDSDPD